MKKKFSVFTQNVRSLRTNVNLLVEKLAENNLSQSAIALSETWHCDDTSFVKILRYQGFFTSNPKRKASGVAVFAEHGIQVQVEDLKNIFCFSI